MKRFALASILSLTAALAVVPQAKASGFILVDSLTPGGMMPVPRPVIVTPPGRRPVVPSPGRRPVLTGSVSYGLHLQDENIKVDITDQVAKTYITQTFKNDTDRNLAGTYLFPLPDDTTFSSFSLHIDGKPVEGKILEANEARSQYEAIVRSMVDPGLLEYADYKTVRARIFPIPAHGTKKVELEYTQILKAENGMLKYGFPLKAKGGDEPIDQVKIDVKLQSKQGLRTIWSPTHIISSNKMSDNLARAAFLGKSFLPDKDFLLYYSVSDKALAANLLTHKAEGEDGYFLLTLTPPLKSTQVVGKDIVLVADTSGSMQGDKMQQARQALKYIINALNPEDRFSIVQFNTDADALKTQLIVASPENKKAALAFVDDLEARGGTNIGDALRMGATMLNQPSTRPAYLVLMTDGEPTVGETSVDKLLKIVSTKRDIRVFDFGVGYEVNTRLLNKLAENNHGTSQYVDPSENLETALSSFYQKIKSPVLSDVKIAYDGIQVKDTYPKSVKDIFAGTQVLLIGKYKQGGRATVNLTGTVNGVAKSYSFPLTFQTQEVAHTYLPRLWAMRRIGYLTDVAQSNGNNKEVVDEIIALSRQYGIISAYTSFLVTDPSEGQRLAANRPMPFTRPPMAVRRSQVAQRAGGGGAGLSWPMPSAAPAMPMAEEGDHMYVNKKKIAFGSALKDYDSGAFSRSLSSGPVVGKVAVDRERTKQELKESFAVKQDGRRSELQSIHDKTFYLVAGVWTDSSFEAARSPKPETVEIGSAKFFEIVKSNPGLAKYLSAGSNMLVVFKGHTYKIIPPSKVTT